MPRMVDPTAEQKPKSGTHWHTSCCRQRLPVIRCGSMMMLTSQHSRTALQTKRQRRHSIWARPTYVEARARPSKRLRTRESSEAGPEAHRLRARISMPKLAAAVQAGLLWGLPGGAATRHAPEPQLVAPALHVATEGRQDTTSAPVHQTVGEEENRGTTRMAMRLVQSSLRRDI